MRSALAPFQPFRLGLGGSSWTPGDLLGTTAFWSVLGQNFQDITGQTPSDSLGDSLALLIDGSDGTLGPELGNATLTPADFVTDGSVDITDLGDRLRITRNANSGGITQAYYDSSTVNVGTRYQNEIEVLAVSADVNCRHLATHGGGTVAVSSAYNVSGVRSVLTSETTGAGSGGIRNVFAVSRGASPTSSLEGDWVEISKTVSVRKKQGVHLSQAVTAEQPARDESVVKRFGPDVWEGSPSLGDGWADNGDGTYTCDGSQTSSSRVTLSSVLEVGGTYQFEFTVLSVSAGSVLPRAGGVTGTAQTSVGLYPEDLESNGTHAHFQANSDFVGTIKVLSVKKVLSETTIPHTFFDLGDSQSTDAMPDLGTDASTWTIDPWSLKVETGLTIGAGAYTAPTNDWSAHGVSDQEITAQEINKLLAWAKSQGLTAAEYAYLKNRMDVICMNAVAVKVDLKSEWADPTRLDNAGDLGVEHVSDPMFATGLNWNFGGDWVHDAANGKATIDSSAQSFLATTNIPIPADEGSLISVAVKVTSGEIRAKDNAGGFEYTWLAGDDETKTVLLTPSAARNLQILNVGATVAEVTLVSAKEAPHTWFWEELNTATRGATRGWPDAAVIVAEADKVTIFDGADPGLPMWMVFNENATTLGAFWYPGRDASSVDASDGVVAIGSDGDTWGALRTIDFANDALHRRSTVGLYGGSPVSRRNETHALDTVSTDTSVQIGNFTINDVALKVLDGDTEPTIAVATNGGGSIIKSDGSVSNEATSTRVEVLFDADGAVWFQRFSTNAFYKATDFSGATFTSVLTYNGALDGLLGGTHKAFIIDPIFACGTTLGLSIRDGDLSANITENYNTGWMNGDIKGAFLADTDDTDLVGAELVTNGGFDTDSDWTDASTGSGSATISGGTATLVGVDSSNRGIMHESFATTSGNTYYIEYEVSEDIFGNSYPRLGTSPNGEQIKTFPNQTTGTYRHVFVAQSATTYFTMNVTSGTFSFDNISVKLADADRSVNNNGLIVNGTVTRSPVATGAELVGYSGFSASNYLEQPYNSDIDFGTGDFCVMGWVKVANGSAKQTVLSRYAATGGGGLEIYLDSLEKLQFRITANDWGSAPRLESASSLALGSWTHFCCFRSGSVMYTFLNGVLSATRADSGNNINNALASAFVGVEYSTSYQFDGSLALLRISATAPTAEQIKKIYEDEKFLFQPKATVTLAGTGGVNDVAYDKTTTALWAAQSDKTSVFNGLVRVSEEDGKATCIDVAGGIVAGI